VFSYLCLAYWNVEHFIVLTVANLVNEKQKITNELFETLLCMKNEIINKNDPTLFTLYSKLLDYIEDNTSLIQSPNTSNVPKMSKNTTLSSTFSFIKKIPTSHISATKYMDDNLISCNGSIHNPQLQCQSLLDKWYIQW
jgi:hypothetical protein